MLSVMQHYVDRESVEAGKRLGRQLVNRTVEHQLAINAGAGRGFAHYGTDVMRDEDYGYAKFLIEMAYQ